MIFASIHYFTNSSCALLWFCGISIQFNYLFHQFVFVVQVKGKISLKGKKHSGSKKTPMVLANLGPSTFLPF